jgi:hypothetical protein
VLLKKQTCLSVLAGLGLSLTALTAGATEFTTDNILMVTQTPGAAGRYLREYDLAGNEIQSIQMIQRPDTTDYLQPRDLAFDSNGLLHIYEGTFDPALATFDPSDDSWSYMSFDGWNTVNNMSYGGLATYKDIVYVTDTLLSGDVYQGIVAFNTTTKTAMRYDMDYEPIDVNMGLDGYLYTTSEMGNVVRKYNPDTMELLATIDLGWAGDMRAIAVDESGNLYISNWYPMQIEKRAADGTLLSSLTVTSSPGDIDLRHDGILVFTTRTAETYVTDTELNFITSFDNGQWNTFLTFVPGTGPMQVEIDIRPNSAANKINPASTKKVTVAVLTTDTFDAASIDPSTVTFGPAGATDIAGKIRLTDVDGDGDLDGKFRFAIADTGIQCGDTQAALSGQTTDGASFEGTDVIKTTRCN